MALGKDGEVLELGSAEAAFIVMDKSINILGEVVSAQCPRDDKGVGNPGVDFHYLPDTYITLKSSMSFGC